MVPDPSLSISKFKKKCRLIIFKTFYVENKKQRKVRDDKDEMLISILPKNKYASSLIEMISFKSLIS